jgi:hypothetical protein
LTKATTTDISSDSNRNRSADQKKKMLVTSANNSRAIDIGDFSRHQPTSATTADIGDNNRDQRGAGRYRS